MLPSVLGFDYMDGSDLSGGGALGMLGDRAGFLKPIRWWFRSWWYSNKSTGDAGRPTLWPAEAQDDDAHRTTVHIVDSWVPHPHPQVKTRSIHVYTNAPFVRLAVNGVPATNVMAVPFFGMATFPEVVFAPGALVADALGPDGTTVVASHTIQSPKAVPTALVLAIEAPSPRTGTGATLVADGEDVAMVSATFVDADGVPVTLGSAASANITFSVTSGAGTIIGLHSGTPASSADGAGGATSGFPAHYGVVMAFIRSTEVRSGTQAERALLRSIHPDARQDCSAEGDGCDGGRTARIVGTVDRQWSGVIVVQAVAAGLKPATISIPVTTDPAMLPLAVARRSARGSTEL